MTEATISDLVNRYWAAANAGDFEGVRDLFTDDVQVEWPQSGESFSGKEACINIYANYPGGRPQFGGLSRVQANGDLAVAEGRMTYPDGNSYLVVSILRLRDGRIAQEVDYFSEPFPAPEWRQQWIKVG